MRAHDVRDWPCSRLGARLASEAAASRAEFEPCACGQVLSSSSVLALGHVEESTQKEYDARRCESGARAMPVCRVPARRVCLLLCILHIMDPAHRVCPFFCVLPAFISPALVSVEEIQGKY